MADPVLFSWEGVDYRSSESFHYFKLIRLPDEAGTLLACDDFTGDPPEPVNLHEVTPEEATGDRAVAFIV